MERRRFRQRSAFLIVIAVVVVAVACGRASDEQIDQALGITPTPTANPTEAGAADQVANASAVASPADEMAGVAALGRTKFQFNCQICHSASGSAPDLLEKGGPYADIDYATLYPIVRDGEGGHTPKPGPIPTFKLTDDDIANMAAYIREQAAPEGARARLAPAVAVQCRAVDRSGAAKASRVTGAGCRGCLPHSLGRDRRALRGGGGA